MVSRGDPVVPKRMRVTPIRIWWNVTFNHNYAIFQKVDVIYMRMLYMFIWWAFVA